VVKKLAHLECVVSFGHNLKGAAPGSVSSIVITPIVETDAVGIRTVGGVKAEFGCAWVEAVHSGSAGFLIALPRGFHVGNVEYAALEIDESVGPVDEVVGGVMGVGGVYSAQNSVA